VSWQSCRLGDVMTLKRGHDLPEQSRLDGDIPVVSSSGITGFHSEAKASAPGVVTGRYGTLGEVFYLDRDYWPLNTALYVIDFKGNDPRFAAYFLRNALKDYQSDKAAVPGVDRNVLHEMKILVPDVPAQHAIVKLLSTYDDLIENNGRRMALLDDSTRLLYQEWFVHLRFPAHEHVHFAEGIPEGWRAVPLAAITTKIGSGFTPRGGESSYLSEGIPLIRSMNVYDDVFDEGGLAYLSDDQAATLDGVAVESKDILLNITGASVARCCMAPERFLPARVNQHVMIIRVDPDKADPFFVHKAINSDERKRQLLSYAQKGSTREALTKDGMARFQIMLPTASLMQQFGEVAAPSFRQRETLALQNQKLRTARDLILPRLMSGEIEV
jgi:type I restriction enzyme S subunit